MTFDSAASMFCYAGVSQRDCATPYQQSVKLRPSPSVVPPADIWGAVVLSDHEYEEFEKCMMQPPAPTPQLLMAAAMLDRILARKKRH